MKKRPWMVSVLSTAYDLKEYREAVIKLLRDKNFEVSAYEEPQFPVETDMHSHDSCLVALDRVDFAIVIIDKRSGGTYYNIDSGEKRNSITKKEYFKAIERGIPIYCFVNQKAYDELHAYKMGYKKFCEKIIIIVKKLMNSKNTKKNIIKSIYVRMWKIYKHFCSLMKFKIHIRIIRLVIGWIFYEYRNIFRGG